jgi:site-specific recombinase XerD
MFWEMQMNMVLFYMSNFHKERELQTLRRLDEVLEELPTICRRFFMGVSQTTAPLTRLAYAYDLRIFFEFLITEIAEFNDIDLANIGIEDLEKIEVFHVELYVDFLSKGIKTNARNSAGAIVRKLSCLRAFFKYFFKKGEIKSNIMPNIDLPKLHDKPIIRLDSGEVARLLDATDGGDGLTDGQKRFHESTRLRDETIVMFFLATGVRISELVGLNIGDIDLQGGSFRVTRKGGNQAILFLPDELRNQLELYLACNTGNEGEPLFMSLQNNRISVRAVQDLVKKYAKLAAPLKNISPHKLRSTFGTNLYRATKDIYVVADVLGHADVNTTKKHYAAISDDVRREAAGKVKIFGE